ncbi:hypothetical protein R3P38DRAFT_1666349 [Favolaschia claudopus]|uniref:Uncharacterized protein n=1 Tax=Favolaschia claudopus TaxID=2862362 RepID=A0AAW0AEB1_9AGAR
MVSIGPAVTLAKLIRPTAIKPSQYVIRTPSSFCRWGYEDRSIPAACQDTARPGVIHRRAVNRHAACEPRRQQPSRLMSHNRLRDQTPHRKTYVSLTDGHNAARPGREDTHPMRVNPAVWSCCTCVAIRRRCVVLLFTLLIGQSSALLHYYLSSFFYQVLFRTILSSAAVASFHTFCNCNFLTFIHSLLYK